MKSSILFDPSYIGKMKLKNRIVMAPMGNINMADPIGRPLPKMIDYFTERAKGGTGLIITGLVPVSFGIDPVISEESNTTYFPRIDKSSRTRLVGWRDLAAAVHSYDSKILIQLSAGLGRVGSPECALKGKLPKSASFNKNFYVPQIPHFPMSTWSIKRIVKAFGQAAINAKVSGIDGIHLHGHEGYLMDQLTSAPWNRRRFGRYRDKFRFGIDVVKEIKRLCGDDFPVVYRIDLTQGLRDSYGDEIFQKRFRGMERTIEEGLAFCKALSEAGVDAFDVDKGCYDNWFYPHPPAYFSDSPYVREIAGRLKRFFREENIAAPVIAVGKMGKPEVAEKVLEEGHADFVMLGRPLLADPYWPRKVREGREKEIVHCIGGQEACIQSFILGGHPCCTVNPYAGFEDTKKLIPAEKTKRIAVIGGGPAGCEASKTAVLRGHSVTLFEKGDSLGGQFMLASEMKIKHDVARYLENLEHQMENLRERGLDIRYNTLVNAETLEKDYDAVICCNGIRPVIPAIPGKENIRFTEARELLKNGMALPDDVKRVTIVGGGVVACELGYSLAAEKGVQVSIVEMLPDLMTGVVQANRAMLLWMMMGKGAPTENSEDLLKTPVKAYVSSQVVRFEKGRVFISANRKREDPFTPWRTLTPENIHNPFAVKIDPYDVEEIAVDADMIVFSTGGSADDALYYELMKRYPKKEIYCVGDAKAAASGWEAITSANDIARHI